MKFTACTLTVAGGFGALRVLGSQSVLMSSPPTSTQPESVTEDQVGNELNAFIPSYEQRDASLPQPLRFGPVTFRPHPFYSFLSASGLQSNTNNSQNSIINTIGAGMTVDLGRHWTLDYTPTLRFYSNHDFRDSVDHAASLTGGTRYEDWVFGFSQSFSQSDSTVAETASQTSQQNFNTELSASHMLNEHVFVDLGLSQAFNFAEQYQDSRQWSTMDWLNYQQSKRLIFGLGAGLGYTKVHANQSGSNQPPDQVYEQLQARVQWRATDQLSFSVNAGFDERQHLAAGYDSQLNPVFGASIEYAPFEHTQISLNASRSVSTSDLYILAQQMEGTTVSVNLNQRLLEKFYVNTSLGYTRTDFTVALGSLSDIRNDNVYSFTARLGRSFLTRGNVALTYQYSDNQSNKGGYSYRSNQVGVEVGFAY